MVGRKLSSENSSKNNSYLKRNKKANENHVRINSLRENNTSKNWAIEKWSKN